MARNAGHATASDQCVKIIHLSLNSSGDFQLAEPSPTPPTDFPSERSMSLTSRRGHVRHRRFKPEQIARGLLAAALNLRGEDLSNHALH